MKDSEDERWWRCRAILPLPPRKLCGNGRVGGWEASRLRREQRSDARLVGLNVLRGATPPLFPAGPVYLSAVVVRARGWSARRLDDDNFWRGMKSALDGLADAGLVSNDRQFVLGSVDWTEKGQLTGFVELSLDWHPYGARMERLPVPEDEPSGSRGAWLQREIAEEGVV